MNKLMMGVVAALMLVSGSALAEIKVGVVDVPLVLSKLPQKDEIGERLKKEFADRVQKVEKLRKDLEALDAKLQKDGALMSETEQSEQVRKLKSLQAQLQIEGQSLEDDSRRRQAEERNALLQKVKTAIDAVAAREGYDVILQGGGVVYAKPNMDLSEKVIAEITKK
ncbi:MAG: OmpH family outer membrane protein [Corallincola sp.]|nr:OmpH family outer membrane protein [Corallincola sp.]